MEFANLKLFLLCCLLIPVSVNANTGLNIRSASETNASAPETMVGAAIRATFARSFRSREVTNYGSSGTSTREIAYVGPDWFQMVYTRENEEGVRSYKRIVIGYDVYSNEDGQWMK